MIDFDQAMRAIMAGDLRHLEVLAAEHDDFPAGRDSFIGRAWLENAIDSGTVEVVR